MHRLVCLLALVALAIPTSAHAEDPPSDTADPPPSEPAPPPPTPTQPPPTQARGGSAPPGAAPSSGAPGLPAPSVTPRQSEFETASALVVYGNRRLSVRSQTHYEGGGYTAYSRSFFPLTPFLGFGTTYVVQNPVTEYKTWSVYQGSQRLTVPVYLEVIGDLEQAAVLRRKIKHRQVGSGVLLGVAAGGIVTAMAGGMTYLFARNSAEAYGGVGMSVGGAVAAILSFGGAWGLAVDGRRLRWDFPSVLDRGIQQQVRDTNEALRTELGLSRIAVDRWEAGPGLR